MKAPILLVLATLSTAQAAEPTGTLTLACQGTMRDARELDAKPDPISMGIINDFKDRTVEGFGSDATFRIVILDVTERSITFGSNLSDPTRDPTRSALGRMA
jgi:hypothetical protein